MGVHRTSYAQANGNGNGIECLNRPPLRINHRAARGSYGTSYLDTIFKKSFDDNDWVVGIYIGTVRLPPFSFHPPSPLTTLDSP